MYKHILVPTDGSPLSSKAVKQAAELAKSEGATMTILHVVSPYRSPVASDEGFRVPEIAELRKRYDEAAQAAGRKIVDAAQKIAAKAGVECDVVVASADMPYDAIIKQAQKRKCDLIMMASHGRRGLQALLLGSETTRVLTHSRIPVLVCR
jgi:nucleotide-binding universal stress UspA family protein